MTDTPRSLLERLRVQPSEDSWKRLVDLYTPLLKRWARQSGVEGADADDLLQEVFAALVREMPAFEHNRRSGAFRRWLRQILVNRVRGYLRTRRARLPAGGDAQTLNVLDRLEDPASDLSRAWDREHDEFVARRLLELIEPEFTASTWRAFWRQVMDGQRPAQVAAELGLSADAVYSAKYHVLRRLRREIEGLTE
jgi:RNA polymerase sigma-70 factor (ECF subfamily)